MHSFTTLAVLALAASTTSPVISAPVRDNQTQARAELEERARFNFTPFLKEIARYGLAGIPLGRLQNYMGTGSFFHSQKTTSTKRTPEPVDPLIIEAAEGLGKTLVKALASFSTSHIIHETHGNDSLSPSAGVVTAEDPVDERDVPEELLATLDRILRRAVTELD